MATITVRVSTNMVGSECERSFDIDQEDLDNMTTEEIDEMCMEKVQDLINWDYDITS